MLAQNTFCLQVGLIIFYVIIITPKDSNAAVGGGLTQLLIVPLSIKY